MKMATDNYARERKHLIEYLNAQTEISPAPEGWLVKDIKDTFPEWSVQLLQRFAGWLLDNYKKGTLAHTQAAVNFYYVESGLQTPWIGPMYHRTMTKYCDARRAIAIDNDEFESGQIPAGCRIAVPEDVISWLLTFAESLPDRDSRLEKCAVILLGFLCLLRASSLYLEKGDVTFIQDGEGNDTVLIVNSLCVKTLDKVSKHQLRCPAPDPSMGPKHPRARTFAVIKRAVARGSVTLGNIAAPGLAHSEVTKWMDELIPKDVSSLVKGEKITSHSLRKAGASAMCSLGIDVRSRVMPWGRWKSIASVERYAKLGYMVSSFSGAMFDWCLPPHSAFAWTTPARTVGKMAKV